MNRKFSYDRFRQLGKIFLISAKRYGKDRNSDRAVTLTYYTLFAIVPVAALLFGIAKGFDLEIKLRQVLAAKFSQHSELLKWIYQFADTTLKQASGGIVAGIGVIALLLTPIMRVVLSLFDFVKQKDWLYVAITAFVLGVIVMNSIVE